MATVHPVNCAWDYHLYAELRNFMMHLPMYSYMSSGTQYPGSKYCEYNPKSTVIKENAFSDTEYPGTNYGEYNPKSMVIKENVVSDTEYPGTKYGEYNPKSMVSKEKVKETVHPVNCVWEYNLYTEFSNIMKHLPCYRYISFDTEYPGNVSGSEYIPGAPPEDMYEKLRENANSTNIIQLGLTLMDPKQCPEYMVWQFNFKDFDISRGDQHSPKSIELLKNGGIDFEKNVKQGIDSRELANLMMVSGFFSKCNDKTWVGFHCAYDFSYMIKMVTMKELPCDLHDFMWLVRYYFGSKIFDLKFMIRDCPDVSGGLQKIATLLKVDRCSNKCHQAGCDSLLTMQIYVKMKKIFFKHKRGKDMQEDYGCKLFDLVPPSQLFSV